MFKKTLKATAIVGALVMTMIVAKPIDGHAASVNGTATSAVNVRTGASTKYRTIGKIKKEQRLKYYLLKMDGIKLNIVIKQDGLVENI